jgi:hypothetical protein
VSELVFLMGVGVTSQHYAPAVSTASKVVASIGGALQVVGVAFVFAEIWGIQRLLNKRTWIQAVADAVTSPFRRLRNWVGSLGKPKAIQAPLEGSNLGFSADLGADLTISEPDDASVEKRLDIHRQRLDKIDSQLKEIREEATKVETRLGDRLAAAVGKALEETKRLREVVDQLGAGSLGLRAVGGVLVLVGSAMWVASEWL